MSRKFLIRLRLISQSSLLFSVGFAIPSRAQTLTNYLIPVVTIQATTPLASWPGTAGTFTVFREGPTNATLNVFYLVGGSASNGVDYATISNWVTIPAGVRTNTITVSPINSGQTNIETVVLKLAESPLMSPINYYIGYPSSATVFITPAGITNLPPLVKMFSPTNGAVFFSPTNIRLAALASDPDGSVYNVEFFAGTNSLGVVSGGAILDPPFPDGTGPGARAFFLVWSNVPSGDYTLTARATDNGGASTISAGINISVQLGPPPTNIPPVVKIEIPQNGWTFSIPVNIPICAGAYDLDGSVTTVEFFAGTNSLGITTNNPIGLGPMNPFCLIWSNVPPGDYVLTAKATDNGGAATISGPVNINVVQGPPPPPPTNYPPIVRIASPPNGAMFRGPLDLPIYAYAKDLDGQVVSVEFFSGTNSLGVGQGVCLSYGGTPFSCPTNLFVLVWSNAPVGSFVLTAKATDDGGASTVSAPVNIAILPPPPPPTNRPPIVSIVASDPLAIEGTNCWPWLGLGGVTPTWGNWTTNIAPKFFTNCGPKNATFVVRRYGDTNEDLVVTYGVGGSATNGVDYVPLSGSVTIPAAERHALITLVPIDDGPPDINSTVILKLTSSTNYIIGFPQRAAALILDSQLPQPMTGMLPDKSFELSTPGPDGAWFHVEFSSDLLNWTSICTNQVVNGIITFVDPDASANRSRFYRAVPEMSPPSD